MELPNWVIPLFISLFVISIFYLDHRLKLAEKRIRVLAKIEVDRAEKARKITILKRLQMYKKDWRRKYT